jgi:ubiquinone/menaquinone biosynthesis C-methylase UbiE
MTYNQKTLWENLASENSRYYINSNKGKYITEAEFRKSGKQDFTTYIFDDPLIRRGTIVEIGCGTGRMTEFMTWMFDMTYGIDISKEMIDQGKFRLELCKNFKLIETDGNTIPLPDAIADTVFSYIVFQHFKTYEMVESNFKEVSRILKRDGIFKVLLRSDTLESLDPWWAGVTCSDEYIETLCTKVGLKLIKLEHVKEYAVWAWITKI